MLLINNKLRILAATVLINLTCLTIAEAKKPPKPPGGDSGRTSYTIVQLDNDDAAWECYARNLNHAGNVVGYVEESPTSERLAAYWAVSGSGENIQSNLELLTGGNGAFGINDFGEIVGYGDDPNGPNQGLYWANAQAIPLLLPSLSENAHTSASAISNDGVICGFSNGLAVAWRVNWVGGEPSVWGPVVLPTLDEKSWSSAVCNNNEDGFAQIVGEFRTANNQTTAAVAWTVQSLTDGTLAVEPVPQILEVGDATALGVNDSGAVCGEAGWPPEAKVWIGSASQTLDRAKKIVKASAQYISNQGIIVGWGDTGQIAREAVVWPSADKDMIKLNKFVGRRSPFVKLTEASAVNELGTVVGTGFTNIDGTGHTPFLAIPD